MSLLTEEGFEPATLEVPKYEGIDYNFKVTSDVLWKSQELAANKLGYSHLKSKWKGWDDKVLTIPEYKFALYDYCKENGFFSKPKQLTDESFESFQSRYEKWRAAVSLLKDDTIYAYAFLKFNGVSIKLYPYQDCIVNDGWRWIDVELSNQIGKSFALQVMATVKFHRDHRKQVHIGLVSKSKEQNGQNMRAVKNFIDNAEVGYDTSESTASMSVTTRKVGDKGYTNNIICTVATTSALGYPFDWIFADEYEFWTNPEGIQIMYDQVFKPRTFHTKGQIVIFSNPNGKNFVSENLQQREITKQEAKVVLGLTDEEIQIAFLDNDKIKQFHVYNFNFLDKPGNTKEEWDMEKRNTHPIQFASTMAAIRTESEGSAISLAQIEDSRSSYLKDAGKHAGKGKNCAFFLDVGHVSDQSVLTGVYAVKNNDTGQTEVHEFYKHYYPVTYPLWRIIGIDPSLMSGNSMNIEDGWEGELQPNLVEVLAEYSTGIQPLFGADITGNKAMVPLLDIAKIHSEDVIMSGPWKADWYGALISLLAQRRFKRTEDENWVDGANKNWEFQARGLKITTKMANGNARQYPLYHHEKESDHDDALDSTVGALSLIYYELDSAPTLKYIEKEAIITNNINQEETYTNIQETEDVDEEFQEQMEKDFMFQGFMY